MSSECAAFQRERGKTEGPGTAPHLCVMSRARPFGVTWFSHKVPSSPPQSPMATTCTSLVPLMVISGRETPL